MKKFLFLGCLLIFVIELLAQKHGTGAILNDSQFRFVLKAPPLTRGDFAKLPVKFSLKKYAPEPGDQGTTSTCTGWAVSYSARTVLAAVNHNWNRKLVTENAFSPSFIYNQIRNINGCNTGASLVDALNVLKNEGTLPIRYFGYDCNRRVTKTDKKKAGLYRIREFRQIANRYNKNKVLNIKKSISQKKPVIIGINCPDSFYDVKDVWQPTEKDYKNNSNGHALTVIGYDDKIYGGAVEVLNSWGKNWGNSGFAWIKYKDLQHFCVWAGEILDKQNQNSFKESAKIFLKRVNGKKIVLSKINEYSSKVHSLKTGDAFQLFIENESPAYLNLVSWDTTKVIKRLFPNSLLESSYLAYSKNYLIFPHENYAFQVDSTKGVTHFLMIFSNKKLNLDKFLFSSGKSKKNFIPPLIKMIKSKLPDKSTIDLINNDKLALNCYSKHDFLQPIFIDIINSR